MPITTCRKQIIEEKQEVSQEIVSDCCIHCIGYSQAALYSGRNDMIEPYPPACYNHPFKCYRIPSYLPYDLSIHRMEDVKKILAVIDKKDKLLFCFGEVDCRWHIPFRMNLNETSMEEEVVKHTNKYIEALLNIKDEQGYSNIIVWGANPSTNKPHCEDPRTPIFGDVYLRNKVTRLFNQTMKSHCETYNMGYADICDYVMNSDYTSKDEYFMDYCHLSATKCAKFIRKELGV